MSKSSEVKKRSRKTQTVAMALCIPEKKPKVECILYLSRDLMNKMWDEDRENIVECRYGQLSSTEKIIIIKKESKQTRSNTKQNNWPCK